MDKKEENFMNKFEKLEEMVNDLINQLWDITLKIIKDEKVFIKEKNLRNARMAVFKGASKKQIKNAILDFYGEEDYLIFITNEEDCDLGYVFDLYLVKPDVHPKRRNTIDSFNKKLNEAVDYIYDVVNKENDTKGDIDNMGKNTDNIEELTPSELKKILRAIENGEMQITVTSFE